MLGIFPKLHWVGIGGWGRQGYLRFTLGEKTLNE